MNLKAIWRRLRGKTLLYWTGNEFMPIRSMTIEYFSNGEWKVYGGGKSRKRPRRS